MIKFTREPVAIVQALIVPLLIVAVGLFGWPESTVGVVNALILAVGGAVAALGVSVDAFLPLAAGVAKAALAVALAFNMDISEGAQTAILSAISIVVAFLTRPQVTAKTQADYKLAA